MMIPNKIIENDLKEILQGDVQWNVFQGANVLVTGATGFIAGYIVETLAYLNETTDSLPVKIYALARNEHKLTHRFSHLINNVNFTTVIQDVNTPWMSDAKIDFIIHAASDASPKKYLNAPVDTIKANTLGIINLLELAKKNNAKLLFLSSGAVYGDNETLEISESSYGVVDPLHPRSCYSESKRLGEAMCMAYWRQYGVAITIARISHTYGPTLNLDDGRVFTDLVADAIADRELVIRGDGLDSRPFCYITDMVRGLFFILINGIAGNAYNVGIDEELSIVDLAELIKKVSGKMYLKINVNNYSQLKREQIRSAGHFNLCKLKSLGWKDLISPEEGFRRMYNYYASQ